MRACAAGRGATARHRDGLSGPSLDQQLHRRREFLSWSRAFLRQGPAPLPLHAAQGDGRRRRCAASRSSTSRFQACARRPVDRMSGGQRQLVAIARGAFWGGKLLLLDEPTAALGVRESREVLDLIERLSARGLTDPDGDPQPRASLVGLQQRHRHAARAKVADMASRRDDDGRGRRLHHRRQGANESWSKLRPDTEGRSSVSEPDLKALVASSGRLAEQVGPVGRRRRDRRAELPDRRRSRAGLATVRDGAAHSPLARRWPTRRAIPSSRAAGRPAISSSPTRRGSRGPLAAAAGRTGIRRRLCHRFRAGGHALRRARPHVVRRQALERLLRGLHQRRHAQGQHRADRARGIVGRCVLLDMARFRGRERSCSSARRSTTTISWHARERKASRSSRVRSS